MKKNIIFAVVIALVVGAAACFVNISSRDEFYSAENPLWESGPAAIMSIECKTAAENLDKLPEELRDERYVPTDGYILAPTKFSIEEGESVYSLFLRAVKYYEIPFEAQGAEENAFGTVYIRGINQLYEFSGGELSGWMYSVNGEFPSVGCSGYELKDGDVVRFLYTLDLGRDIGGDIPE